MAKFKFIEPVHERIIYESDDLENFWENIKQTDYFHEAIINVLWDCCTNYHLNDIQCLTSKYIYPYVEEYVEKMSEIDTTTIDGIYKFEKIDNIIIDIIATICKNDDDCRDLIIKDFPDFWVDD